MSYSVPRSTTVNFQNSEAGRNKNDDLYENVFKYSLPTDNYDVPISYNIPLEELKPLNKRRESTYDEVGFQPRRDLKQYSLSSYSHPILNSQPVKPCSTPLASPSNIIRTQNTSLNEIKKISKHHSLKEPKTKVKDSQGCFPKLKHLRCCSIKNKTYQVNYSSDRSNRTKKRNPPDFDTISMTSFKKLSKRNK